MSSCMWWDHFAVFKILSLFYFSTFWLKCAWVWIFLCLSYFVIIGVCRTSHTYVFYIRLGSYQPLFCQILFLPHSLTSVLLVFSLQTSWYISLRLSLFFLCFSYFVIFINLSSSSWILFFVSLNLLLSPLVISSFSYCIFQL